jgi:Tol biopolymer transport system component
VNVDGSGLTRVTDSPERDDYATWHPDGRSIVFVGERNGKFDLYRVEIK